MVTDDVSIWSVTKDVVPTENLSMINTETVEHFVRRCKINELKKKHKKTTKQENIVHKW